MLTVKLLNGKTVELHCECDEEWSDIDQYTLGNLDKCPKCGYLVGCMKMN